MLASSLALEASRLEPPLEPVAAWTGSLRGATVFWMVLDQAATAVADRLDRARVAWAPIKGYDLGTRFYAERERRLLSDLDLLVARSDLESALDTLEADGWRPLEPSERTRRFVEEEGYTYHFARRMAEGLPPVLLEVHFRFWGFVVEEIAEQMLERRVSWDGSGAGRARLEPADAYVLAAVHGWTKTSPRDLVDWFDLEVILRTARDAGLATELMGAVVSRSRLWSTELPVALSARVAAKLWPDAGHQDVVSALEPSLSRRERALLESLENDGIDGVPLSRIVLARLRSGRRSRAGWRSVWRRLWAHPGVVELETSDGRPWLVRRLEHLARSLGG